MDNRFGTTEDMIIQPVEENGATYMLAIDKAGLYHDDSHLCGERYGGPQPLQL